MRRLLVSAFLFLSFAATASAQSLEDRVEPGTAAGEITFGYTGFADDDLIHHASVGGTLRGHLTSRISVGAEVSYHVGPARDRDVLLQGLAIVDFRRPRVGQVGRVEPYVLVGGGLMTHDGGFGSSVCPTMMWGGGARIWVARRTYLTADTRLGWPPHVRVIAGVGVLLR